MQTVSDIQQSLLNSSITKGALIAYYSVVGLGFLWGAYAGCENYYYRWACSRTKVTVNSPIFDPILNICRDAGVWGYNVLTAGFVSALVIATFPVSVPLLLALSKNVGHDD